jgi:hypothetical protein
MDNNTFRNLTEHADTKHWHEHLMLLPNTHLLPHLPKRCNGHLECEWTFPCGVAQEGGRLGGFGAHLNRFVLYLWRYSCIYAFFSQATVCKRVTSLCQYLMVAAATPETKYCFKTRIAQVRQVGGVGARPDMPLRGEELISNK